MKDRDQQVAQPFALLAEHEVDEADIEDQESSWRGRTEEPTQPASHRSSSSSFGAFLFLTLCVTTTFFVATALVFYLSSAPSSSSSLPPLEEGAAPVYLAVVGDYGRKGEYNQHAVAQQMSRACLERTVRHDSNSPMALNVTSGGRCDALVGTGDNFYSNGINSLQDPHLNVSFEHVYTLPGLMATPFFQLNGNHDYRGRPDVEIEYTKQSKDGRWQMPDYFYEIVLEAPSPKQEEERDENADEELHLTRIHLIFIDTTPFHAKYGEEEEINHEIWEERRKHNQEQVQWVQEQLQKYKLRSDVVPEDNATTRAEAVDYRIVVGHHPLYSYARHGNSQEMIDTFEDIFLEGKVFVYLCGHDHNLQHIQRSGQPLHHLLSGAGSEVRPVNKKGWFDHSLQRSYAQSSFMFLRFDASNVHVQWINHEGDTVETFSLPNPYPTTTATTNHNSR